MRKTILILAVMLAGAGAVRAALPVADALGEERLGLWRVAVLPWRNPAVNQWRMQSGLTTVGAGYSGRSDGYQWSLGADTYTKYRNSTLWGSAAYANGKDRDVVWCETADRDIVYPYLLADSVGGDLSRETYTFSGGYADRKGRWAWGASLSYRATLEYRDVDPRPKNVVGCLDASAGAAFLLGKDYYAGVSLAFRKYKQSNDIDFKSEMGVDKIFHLTGMGTHYRRFAGAGLDTYYDGYRYGVTADIYPSSGRGVFVSVDMSRFSFDNILSDFNKLPMASASHRAIEAEAGWLSGGERTWWGVAARADAYRRHGRENIFGDAAAGIYPQIGSNEMYADNGTGAGLRGMWGCRFGDGVRFAAMADGAWNRRVTTYIEPWRHSRINAITAALSAGALVDLPHGWLAGADAGVSFYSPFSCGIVFTDRGADSETAELENLELNAYERASTGRTRAGARLSAAHAIAGRYMLQLAAEMRHHDYAITLNLIF